MKNIPVVSSHGHPAVRGRGFTPLHFQQPVTPYFQQPVTLPKPPTAPIHGQGHGRGIGAGHIQVKTAYMPPPSKTQQQVKQVEKQVKKMKQGTSLLQIFYPQLKAQ